MIIHVIVVVMFYILIVLIKLGISLLLFFKELDGFEQKLLDDGYKIKLVKIKIIINYYKKMCLNMMLCQYILYYVHLHLANHLIFTYKLIQFNYLNAIRYN